MYNACIGLHATKATGLTSDFDSFIHRQSGWNNGGKALAPVDIEYLLLGFHRKARGLRGSAERVLSGPVGSRCCLGRRRVRGERAVGHPLSTPFMMSGNRALHPSDLSPLSGRTPPRWLAEEKHWSNQSPLSGRCFLTRSRVQHTGYPIIRDENHDYSKIANCWRDTRIQILQDTTS